MPIINYKDLAQEAYRTYGETVGFKNWQGLDIPTWAELSAKQQLAWENATEHVCKQFNRFLINTEGSPNFNEVSIKVDSL